MTTYCVKKVCSFDEYVKNSYYHYSNISITFLCIGMKERAHMDDVLYSPKEMFGKLALDYNNDEQNVELPTAAEDLECYSLLDTTRE